MQTAPEAIEAMPKTAAVHPERVPPREQPSLLEAAVSLILLGLGIVFLKGSIDLGLLQNGSLGAGFFPALVAAAGTLLSAAWVATLSIGYVRWKRYQATGGTAIETDSPIADQTPSELAHSNEEPRDDGENWDDWDDDYKEEGVPLKTIGVVVISAIMLPLVPYIGMTPVLFLYVSTLLIVIARIRPLPALTFTLIASILLGLAADQVGIFFPDPLGVNHFFLRMIP